MNRLILPPEITDIHTHDPSRADHAIVNRRFPQEALLESARWQSVGLHPWDIEVCPDPDWQEFRRLVSDPRVIAIGEAGLDALRGPSADIQEKIFIPQALIAEETGKPLVIHCVKALDRILRLRKSLRPDMPWIIHGFRGNIKTARQLVAAGLYLSLGERFNPEVSAGISPEYILRESD